MSAGEFDGLVAVVTGGASGIGLATASALADRGARVAVLDLNPDGLPEATDRLPRRRHRPRVGGCGDRRGRRHASAASTSSSTARGSARSAPSKRPTTPTGRGCFDINVTGTARVSAAALPWLRRSDHAAIVNVCSIAALNGLPQRAVYSASKGAVLALTFAMATDHVAEGIRVNCVNPGTVSTPFVERMLQNFDDPVKERAALDARQATGRMVTPDEVAGAIAVPREPALGLDDGNRTRRRRRRDAPARAAEGLDARQRQHRRV